MAIYLVTPLSENFNALRDALTGAGLDFFEVQNTSGLLVQADMTAVELSQKLGVTAENRTPGPNGLALIVRVGSYYGRGSGTMWDWLKVKMEHGA